MKDPTMTRIVLKFLFVTTVCIYCLVAGVNSGNLMMAGLGMVTAFFLGWKTKEDLFLIEFKEMLELVKKLSQYVDKEV